VNASGRSSRRSIRRRSTRPTIHVDCASAYLVAASTRPARPGSQRASPLGAALVASGPRSLAHDILGRDAVRRVLARSGRPYAPRPDQPDHARPRPHRPPAAPPGQDGDAQSRRVGQGPDRTADDRGGRAGGTSPAWRHHHRADQRKHRPAGDRRRAQRLSLHLRGMADKQSAEKQALLRAYGAEVVLCPTNVPPESPVSYYSAGPLARDIPGRSNPDQYWNMENPTAHERTTGPECGTRPKAASPFRGQRRDGRDDLRRRARPQGAQPGDPGHRRRSGGQCCPETRRVRI
jgi:hypothetical protein